jgi:hypothetical protein
MPNWHGCCAFWSELGTWIAGGSAPSCAVATWVSVSRLNARGVYAFWLLASDAQPAHAHWSEHDLAGRPQKHTEAVLTSCMALPLFLVLCSPESVDMVTRSKQNASLEWEGRRKGGCMVGKP